MTASFVLRISDSGHQVSDQLILFLEICAFPPIRQKQANGARALRNFPATAEAGYICQAFGTTEVVL
jgi:hypothetical protein